MKDVKNVIGYIFKGWKISDWIILAISLIGTTILLHISQFPIEPAICGWVLLLGTIYANKNTVLGYVIALGALGYYSWYLLTYGFMGDFILTVGMQMPLIAFAIASKFFSKLGNLNDKFEKWDLIVLLGSLAVMAFPTYLLLVQIESSYAIFQMASLLLMFAVCFLQFKGLAWSKYLCMLISAAQLALFVFKVVELEVSVSTLAFGIFFSFVVQLVYFAIDMAKLKKQRKANVKEKGFDKIMAVLTTEM